MKAKNLIGTLLTGAFCLASCTGTDVLKGVSEPNLDPNQIGFYVDLPTTKTNLSENGKSLVWVSGDKLHMWAYDKSADSLFFKNHEFSLYGGRGLSRAYFTTVSEKNMPEGNYLYAACHPAPTSVDSATVSFKLPNVQNGKFTDVDFLVATPVEGKELKKLPKVEDYSALEFQFRHKFHILRFYIPEDFEGAEDGIREFKAIFPTPVTGTYVTDLYNEGKEEYIMDSDATRILHMNLAETLRHSDADGRHFAYAGIVPFQSKEGDKLNFVNEDTLNIKVSFNTLSLEGRNFEAGHMTSVAIKPTIKDRRDFTVKFTGSELEDPVNKLRLIGPEGLVWEKSGSNILEIEDEDGIEVGSEFTELYSLSKDLYDKITDQAPQDIIVRMISGKIGKRTSLALNRETKKNFHLSMEAYMTGLLDEDFSNMPSFNNHSDATDGYQGDAGNDFSTTFLNGWSGGRVGGEEGKCIRIAARREVGLYVEAKYPARVDSEPVFDVYEPVDIILSFDYGVDEKGFVTSGSYEYVGQTFYVGYVNGTNVRASGNTEMIVAKEQNIPKNSQRSGSYNSTPLHMDVEMHLEPGEDYRMTWRNDTGSKRVFGGNSTTWLYIDNVKVTIKETEETE